MASYLTASIKRSYAENLLTELERNENQYFFFVGKATAWDNENSPSSYTNTVANEYQVMNDIIGYKKLDPKSIIFALPRYEWTSGTTYDQYDDSVDLFDENNPSIFYVVTDENHVYKCLNNNGGSPSTEKPTGVLPVSFGVTGGYIWQYLATVRDSDLPYELTDYIPIDFAYSSVDTETVNQYNAQSQAVSGSITRIETTNSSGASAGVYPNTVTPDTIGSSSLYAILVGTDGYTANADGKFVTITDPNSVSNLTPPSITDTTKFSGYIFRITENTLNPSDIGKYALIESVDVSSNSVRIKLQDDVVAFSLVTKTEGSPSAVVSAEILPYIKITGNGSGAYAYPTVNSSKQITAVNVVNGGRDYTKVLTEATSPKNTTTNHPVLRAVVSPKGGHASNILQELNSKDIIVIVKITEEDREKLLEGGSYRQFGIIKNPLLTVTKNEAGKENVFYRDMTLTPVSGEPETSRFNGDSFNLVIGSESYSVSKIASVRALGTNTVTLKTVNSSGKFITRQDRSQDYTVTVAATDTSFLDGETVVQTIPQGTVLPVAGYLQGISYGFPITSTGVVLYSAGSTVGIRLTSNSGFVSGYTMSGNISKESKQVTAVSPAYGESVYVTRTENSVPVVVSDRQYRVVDIGVPYSEQSNSVAYSGLHVLQLSSSVNTAVGAFDVTSAPLSQNSYSSGDTVYQGATGQFGHYASGVVYRWDYENSGSGKLYLTDVIGSFKNVRDHGLTGSTLGSAVVSSVTLPEIDKGSGEILYIDNVRPIQRAIGQQEEFRIRLGF